MLSLVDDILHPHSESNMYQDSISQNVMKHDIQKISEHDKHVFCLTAPLDVLCLCLLNRFLVYCYFIGTHMSIDFTTLKRANDPLPPRLLFYGMEKIGKTTLAAGAPDAVFLLTEDGVGLNEVSATPIARNYDEFVGYLSNLASQDHGFKTLVIDSITGLEKLIFAKVCETEGVDSIEKAMGGFGKGYVRAFEYWQGLLAMLDIIRKDKQMMILLIGHADVMRFSPPDNEAYDRYSVRMNKQTIGAVQKWVDGIFFIKKNVTLVKDKGSERKRPAGSDDRYVYTTEQPAFFGGNRYNLPEMIGPVSKGAPELWTALVQNVPFLTARYAAAPQPQPSTLQIHQQEGAINP